MESKNATNTILWIERRINSRVCSKQVYINNFVIGNNVEEQPHYLQQVEDLKNNTSL